MYTKTKPQREKKKSLSQKKVKIEERDKTIAIQYCIHNKNDINRILNIYW